MVVSQRMWPLPVLDRIVQGREAVSEDGNTPTDDFEVIPLSATRKTIGKRLTEAKQTIPHFYLTVDYELDGLLKHRESLNAAGGISG